MKNILLVIPALFFIHSVFSQTITIFVEELTSKSGIVNIGVFNSEQSYQTKTLPVAEASVEVITDNKISTCINLPEGKYAIAVFHDENGDNQLNTKKLGIPTEGVGFSGRLKSKIRAPKFNEALFHLQRDTAVHIVLKYPDKKD